MTKETLIKSALRALVNEQVKQGSVGYALEEDSAYEVSWKDVFKWLEQQPSEDCISREQTLKAFAEKCYGECACCKYNGSDNNTAENCKLIKSIPSAIPSYNSIKTELKPCEDCISREAAIKIFGEVHPMDYNTQAYITKIQNLPSVTLRAESEDKE